MTVPVEVQRPELAGLWDETVPSRRKRGVALFSPGVTLRFIYYIESGFAKIFKPLPGNREFMLKIAGPGEFCGISGLATDEIPRFSAVMLADGMVRALPHTRFAEFAERNPALWRWLAAVEARHRLALERRLEILALPEAHERILALLPGLANTCGVKDAAGFITIQLKQDEIAGLTGTTRETASTNLNVLARRGLVELRRGRLLIPSLEEVKKAAAETLKTPYPGGAAEP